MGRNRAVGGVSRQVLLIALLLAEFASPALGASAERSKQELQDLKTRIEKLHREVAAGEESRANVADQLRESEMEISTANRHLHELSGEAATLRTELAELDAQGRRLDKQTAAQQDQLARLLNREFVGGDSEAIKLLLAGQDPNQAARDRHFLTLVSRARANLIQQLRVASEDKKRLAETVRGRQAQLDEVRRQEQESRTKLIERRKQRQAQLVAIADKLKAQRREIDTLKRDEQRMARLIDGLTRIAAAKKPGARNTAKAAPRATTSRGTKLKDNDPGKLGGAFGALRGRLRLPVAGSIAGRFGTPRPEGGAVWKGLFIRAAEGAEVKAVAQGTVVFSDWLRGFGNLLVIDHGDDFMSVYGNNESLLASVGAAIKGGDAIATVGKSGGNPQSGLYFELRHRGLAFDPLKWAAGP